MLQLLAWIIGIVNSVSINAPYLRDAPYVWWHGIAFAVLLYPAVWLLGFVFPRLILNVASGAMIGGAISSALALFTGNLELLPGSLITWLSGYLAAKGQNLRLGG